MKKKTVRVNDKMQRNYQYQITQPTGGNFDHEFQPDLTPKQMLSLGVFGGRYMRDCKDEFPSDWFNKAKFHPENTPGHSKQLNFFQVEASQPLSVWRKKGWIHDHDPRGWFQWYCRYFMGRRMPEEDQRQIKRWKAMRRHVTQVRKNCVSGNLTCRKKQRQALLHWAYDSRQY